jgi:hypothetical protein
MRLTRTYLKNSLSPVKGERARVRGAYFLATDCPSPPPSPRYREAREYF